MNNVPIYVLSGVTHSCLQDRFGLVTGVSQEIENVRGIDDVIQWNPPPLQTVSFCE